MVGTAGLLPSTTAVIGPASWFGGQIVAAIADALHAVVRDLLTAVALPITRFVLQTPDLLAEPTLRRYWVVSLAALGACAALLVALSGLALIPGTNARIGVLARETLGVRLLSGLATATVSLSLVALEVDLANRIAALFVTAGLGPATNSLVTTIAAAAGGDAGAGLGLLVISVVGVVLLVTLVVVGLVRWATVWLLVVLAPIAMGFATLPSGAEVARLWWRLQLTAVFLPVANAALLGTYVAMFSSQRTGLVGALSGVAVLALLTKLPMWVAGVAVDVGAHDVTHRLWRARRGVRIASRRTAMNRGLHAR